MLLPHRTTAPDATFLLNTLNRYLKNGNKSLCKPHVALVREILIPEKCLRQFSTFGRKEGEGVRCLEILSNAQNF